MTDIDIKALIEKLRVRRAEPWTMSLMRAAADALETLQCRAKKAEALEKAFEPRERALEARAEKAEAERDGIRLDLNDCNNERVKAEAERDAALFDKAVAGGKVRVAEARAEKAEAALAQPDDRSGSHACEYCGGTGIAHDQEGDRP